MSELAEIRRAQAGDQTALDGLIRRHTRTAYGIASDYFTHDGDKDDLRQEALIGLCKAIRDYQPALGSFVTFSHLCMRRHVITAVKTSTREKHRHLTYSLREGVNDDGNRAPIVDLLEARGAGPQLAVELREEIHRLGRALRVDLTAAEADCLILFANGLSYQEIAAEVGGTPKHVDQAICRARWKLNGQGPPSKPTLGAGLRDLPVFSCPTCGRESRQPDRDCNVCAVRELAA